MKNVLIGCCFVLAISPITGFNAATGEVVENIPVTPRDFGVPQDPGIPTQDFGLDPEMTGDEFWKLRDRFYDISPLVWEIFDTGVTRPSYQNLEIIREYESIFRRIAKAPLLPYYQAVASDFFDWLSKVLK